MSATDNNVMTIDRSKLPPPNYNRIESVMFGDRMGTLHFDTVLTGPSGVHVYLFALPDTTPEEIEAAKNDAYRKCDVTGITVRHIKPEHLPPEFKPNPQAATTGWLEAARTIVASKMARRIDQESQQLVPENRRGGTLVDLTTASLLCQVYDKLNEVNRTKFAAFHISVAIHVAYKLAK